MTTTAKRTKTAKLASIKKRHAPIWEKGGGKKWGRSGGVLYNLNNRLPAQVFQDIDEKGKERVKSAREARGWARKGWYAVGRALGLSIPVPAYVAKADVKAVHVAQVVQGAEKEKGKSYTLTIGNSSKIAKRLNLGRTIGTAIKGRIGFFRQNLKKGVFNDIKQRAANYKGITFR